MRKSCPSAHRFSHVVATCCLTVVVISILITPTTCQSDNRILVKTNLENNRTTVREDDTQVVVLTLSPPRRPTATLLSRPLRFNATIHDERTASLEYDGSQIIWSLEKDVTISLTIIGNRMGIATLSWSLLDQFDSRVLEEGEITVGVVRKQESLQILFTIFVLILVQINNINMGCFLDLEMIRNVLAKPVAPLIGFLCQFLFMPLASFGIGLLLFPGNTSWRLGLFVLGCCPGGTGSNFWTLLFDGDVDLSITMTFVSTIAALGKLIPCN